MVEFVLKVRVNAVQNCCWAQNRYIEPLRILILEEKERKYILFNIKIPIGSKNDLIVLTNLETKRYVKTLYS